MTTTYSNLPSEKKASSSDLTVQIFNNYYKDPINLNNGELVAMTGFFEKRGFDPVAAESTSVIILTQARKDGYNAMQIMDTLKSLGDVEISGLVAEILNYNRINTSYLGVVQNLQPSDEVIRQIID